MQRTVVILILGYLMMLGSWIPAFSQVLIINDNLFSGRMSEISATVVDSLTNEPVAFASVYVIPAKDTTITNFTLTDAEGKAKLEEVPYGNYVFHVEMMGYKPFIKERYLRDTRVDMGTIRLCQDEQFLKAAVISDVGNPVVIKQDTVEFNASSFRVGSNAMLKDLLKRMPGMEITEDGKVKFNGEEIDRITVGGRTFFFNDQSTAINNLPASIVDKVRVIDRDSEASRSSGMQDGSREKILDVGLKKEYEKGWFGNAGVKAGTTVGGDDDAPLRDDRGLLYNGNALVSAYSETDQVTVIANAQNVNDSNAIVFVSDGENEFNSATQGLSSAAQIGANVNTSRVKDVETTVGANFKYSDTDLGTSSARTTYQDNGNLLTAADNTGRQFSTSVSSNLEMKKEKGDVWFHFRPSFNFRRNDARSAGTSRTSLEGGDVTNSSENLTSSLNISRNANMNGDISLRNLWGKKGRIINIDYRAEYASEDGSSTESSLLKTVERTDSRELSYDSDGNSHVLAASVRFTEPFGEKWTVSFQGGLHHSRSERIRDAFDALGRNDYYSSESRNNYYVQGYELYAQYKFNPMSWVTLGAKLNGTLNETFSRSFGIEETSGKGEWTWFVTPNISFMYAKDGNRFNFNVSGMSRQPSAARMLPVLNIADPSRLSMGNIYLRPYSNINIYAMSVRNNRKKFSNLMIYYFGSILTNPINNAIWYDKDGIMYSIPVNSRKPTVSGSLNVNYTTPLDSKKLWFVSLWGGGGLTSSTSYQTKGYRDALDKDNFDYSSFMEGFWGDASGDRFYGGSSGFQESTTRIYSPSGSISLRYNRERYSFTASTSATGRVARYSLDPSVNMNTLDLRFGTSGSYITKHEFEFASDLTYVLYKGYASGYGAPELQWNASVSKNIGAFTLSLTAHDILDQTRNLTHTVTANYEEDTYRLVMGRYLLFGVKWNFGKMNAAHSQRASSAAWNMAW